MRVRAHPSSTALERRADDPGGKLWQRRKPLEGALRVAVQQREAPRRLIEDRRSTQRGQQLTQERHAALGAPRDCRQRQRMRGVGDGGDHVGIGGVCAQQPCMGTGGEAARGCLAGRGPSDHLQARSGACA